MDQAISTQHPAVVLRSRYRQLRALLTVAMIAVVGLTAAVVVLAPRRRTTPRPAQQSGERAEPGQRRPVRRRARGERGRDRSRHAADGERPG